MFAKWYNFFMEKDDQVGEPGIPKAIHQELERIAKREGGDYVQLKKIYFKYTKNKSEKKQS